MAEVRCSRMHTVQTELWLNMQALWWEVLDRMRAPRTCHGESSSAVNRATKTKRSCLKMHLQYCQSYSVFVLLIMREWKSQIMKFLAKKSGLVDCFFHTKKLTERLKLQKCPAILPGDLACLHGTLSYWVRTMTTEPYAFYFSNPIFHWRCDLFLVWIKGKGSVILVLNLQF